jgi:hypothetical protein
MIVLDTHIWVNWILGGDAALSPAVVFDMQKNRLAVSGMGLRYLSPNGMAVTNYGKLNTMWDPDLSGDFKVGYRPINRDPTTALQFQ